MGSATQSACTIGRVTPTEPAICVVPTNKASCEDLQTVFGTRGQGARCQCHATRPLVVREPTAYSPGGLRRQRSNRITTRPGVGPLTSPRHPPALAIGPNLTSIRTREVTFTPIEG
jgi:hypothetical protein